MIKKNWGHTKGEKFYKLSGYQSLEKNFAFVSFLHFCCVELLKIYGNCYRQAIAEVILKNGRGMFQNQRESTSSIETTGSC
jgi:hypothetical protein